MCVARPHARCRARRPPTSAFAPTWIRRLGSSRSGRGSRPCGRFSRRALPRRRARRRPHLLGDSRGEANRCGGRMLGLLLFCARARSASMSVRRLRGARRLFGIGAPKTLAWLRSSLTPYIDSACLPAQAHGRRVPTMACMCVCASPRPQARIAHQAKARFASSSLVGVCDVPGAVCRGGRAHRRRATRRGRVWCLRRVASVVDATQLCIDLLCFSGA